MSKIEKAEATAVPEWVQPADHSAWEAMLSKYADAPTIDVPYVNMKAIKPVSVDPAWETSLSDMLFMIQGFSSFFGGLACQCRYFWTFDIPTAGAAVIDGKFFVLMNPAFMFIHLKENAHRNFVIVHEVYHIFYEHGDRGHKAGFNPELFNMAADFYIHWNLRRLMKAAEGSRRICNLEIIPQNIFPICDDEKYDGMTEEEIYKDLEQQAKNNKQPGTPQSAGGSGQRSLDAPAQESVGGSHGNAGKNRNAVATAIRAAAVQAQKQGSGPGTAEGDLIRQFIDLTTPTVDWREECFEYFESIRSDRSTYSHYNRRSSESVIFPSKEGDFIRMFYGIDTSGSMGVKDLNLAGSNLQAVFEQLDSWEVTVASCDAKAFIAGELSSEEEDDLTTVPVELKGGGGTVMGVMIDLMQELHEEDAFNVAVIVTDGHLNKGDIANQYNGEVPLIVLVTEDGKKPEWLEGVCKVIQMES